MKKARDKENSEASVTKKQLKLSLNRPTKDRFAYLEDKVIKTINKGYVHPNTEKNTKWLLKCFNEWWYARNENGKAMP